MSTCYEKFELSHRIVSGSLGERDVMLNPCLYSEGSLV